MRKVEAAFLDIPEIALEAVEELYILFVSVQPVMAKRSEEGSRPFVSS
jgi:hypothetical protein